MIHSDTITMIACTVLILMSIVSSFTSIFFRKIKLSEPVTENNGKEDEQTNDEGNGTSPANNRHPAISVILCVHDNARDIERHLPAILSQDYPAGFEVVIVQSKGEDDTDDVLKQLKQNHKNLYTTFVPDSARYMSRPKLAVTLGVKAAKNSWILLTEPTCHPASDKWLSTMASHCTDKTDIVIGYSNYNDEATDFRRFELLQSQLYILREAQLRTAYRCEPGNLMFRKDMFINGRSFDGNLKFIRGEYDFIVNKFAQKGRTETETDPSAWMLFDDPTDKQWNNNRLYYMETRKHLQRTFRHRLSHAVDQLLLHANLLGILSAIAWCVARLINQNHSTSTWAVGAAAILALLITAILRSLFAANVFKAFHEDIPAWKVLPFEASVIWRQFYYRIKYHVADKYDFISHKV